MLYNKIPKTYFCGVCGAKDVKLWRVYQQFDVNLFCAACAVKNQNLSIKVQKDGKHLTEFGTFSDQVGWLVPAVPAEDGYWGYTSVPQIGINWWCKLPLDHSTLDISDVQKLSDFLFPFNVVEVEEIVNGYAIFIRFGNYTQKAVNFDDLCKLQDLTMAEIGLKPLRVEGCRTCGDGEAEYISINLLNPKNLNFEVPASLFLDKPSRILGKLGLGRKVLETKHTVWASMNLLLEILTEDQFNSYLK